MLLFDAWLLQIANASWDLCEGVVTTVINSHLEEAGGFDANKRLPIINGTATYLARRLEGTFEELLPEILPTHLVPANRSTFLLTQTPPSFDTRRHALCLIH